MKIFICWSGNASKAAAHALSASIREVFNGVEPWLSADNIAPGQQWFAELMDALEEARFAIVCLTARTLSAPWLMFESGAVSAKFGSSRVVPLLLDCAAKDLVDPLARFQATTFDRDSMLQMFKSINATVDAPLKPVVLKAAFNEIWPELESAVTKALKSEGFDVFLSAPMASFKDDSEYKPFHAEVMKVVRALRDRCGLSVFCALEKVDSMAKFDMQGVSIEDDVDGLRDSRSFVMLYPAKLATSALFEAGYALAMGLPCRFFVRQEEDLPFLLRRLDSVFTNVSIVDHTNWKTYEEICDCLERNTKRWFRRGLVAKRKA